MIKAKLITEKCSDLKVVNSARVSMKVSHPVFQDPGDTKLINYLAKHAHWTPFSHNRDIIFLKSNSALMKTILFSLSVEEKASMVIQRFSDINGEPYIAIKTSFYGWVNIAKSFKDTYIDKDGETLETILSVLYHKYPVSFKAYFDDTFIDYFSQEMYNLNQDILRASLPYLREEMFDITFYETVPIFVARQRFKHMVMNTYNEVSKRYVDDTPEIYFPDIWRLRPDKSIKQGSGGDHPETDVLSKEYEEFSKICLNYYDKLINVDKVAPEQARMVLPQSMMTEYYVTANITAWDRFIKQRTYSGAQKEIRDLAEIVNKDLMQIKSIINDMRMNGALTWENLETIGVF